MDTLATERVRDGGRAWWALPVIALVASALAIPGTGRADFAWQLPALDVSAPGQDATSPQVAVAPDGSTTIVWTRSTDTGNSAVQAATRAAGARTFTAPVDVSAPGQEAGAPQIAVAGNGAVTAVWQRLTDNGTWVVQAADRAPGATTFDPPTNLTATAHAAFDPQVAVAADGSATAVWTRIDDTGHSVVQGATRVGGTKAFSAPADLSAGGRNASAPQVAVAADGSATAVWVRRNDDNNWVVQAATRAAGTDTFPTPATLSAPGRNAFDPQVASTPDGATTVVWTRHNDAGPSVVQAAARPAGAGTFTGPVDVSAEGRNTYNPQIAVAADGTTTVVWQRLTDAGSHLVQTAYRGGGGAAFTTPATLSTVGQDAISPQVAVSGDGTTRVVWTSDAGGYTVQTAARAAGADGFGAPVSLSAPGPDADNPQVAGATVAWQRRDTAGNTIIQASAWEDPPAAAPGTAPDQPQPNRADPPPAVSVPLPAPTSARPQVPHLLPSPSKACRKAKKRLKKADTRKERKAAKKAVRRACRK